jgi:hypothetical protein
MAPAHPTTRLSYWPDREARKAIRSRMQEAADQLRLPFRSRVWRGAAGNWMGSGIGSSIDFQDHRPYLPGDDPRYIDWLAYARSGHFIMKLYREEVSPRVDLVLDTSASMFIDPDKASRVLELFYFAFHSARHGEAAPRAYLCSGSSWTAISMEAILGGDWEPSIGNDAAPPDLRLPWRTGSLRVFISDLLYPAPPADVLRTLAGGKILILAPFAPAESDPGWDGNLELEDCESGRVRLQRVEPETLARYRAAYRRHFDLWRDECRRHDVLVARVDARGPFLDALKAEALRAGVVEIWS